MYFFRTLGLTKKESLFSSGQVRNRGFSFIELIVTAAIMALVFGGLFSAYETIISLIAESRMKSNALALVSERMEYIRSLSYNAVGTVSGVPSGLLPQTSTTSLNGVTYVERILVSYIDDDADGVSGADSNSVTSDYKLVKIEYSWVDKDGTTSSIFHTTNIVPEGIETTAGGGTIRVNVFDASFQPVSGAEVRFIQASSSINTPRYTGASGEAYLSGAPQGSDYEVYVTKAGYSSDGTYIATSTNPNPLTLPVSVVENQVSTLNFQIDELSNLTILTTEPAVLGNFADDFTDSSKVATSSDITVSGGVSLLGTPGTYPASGSLQTIFVSPATLYSWTQINSNVTLPPGTSVRVFVYHDSLVPQLVPDSDLPGNSSGFTTNPIDLSGLDPIDYPELAFGAFLETSDTNVTPEIIEWELSYVVERVPLAGVPIRVTGQKSIGSDFTFQVIPKYDVTTSSNGSGEVDLSNIEWDTFTITETSGSYIASEVCPLSPFSLNPDTSEEVLISLVPTLSDTLRVSVTEGGGAPVANATVLFDDGIFSDTQITSQCGQVLFDTPGTGATSTITVQKTGYTDSVVTDVSVSPSGSVISVVLVP